MSLRSVFARAALVAALAVPALAIPQDAGASVSIAVGFDALVKDADAVAVITPGDAYSVWEDGRIISYTKVKVDQSVAGNEMGTGAEGYVRTMGGVVGKIGQLVDGEPVLTTGKQSLLFLRKFKVGGIYEVSARAQGQYPIAVSELTKAKTLKMSSNAGTILPPRTPAAAQPADLASQPVSRMAEQPRLAQAVLHDKPLGDVTREIATTWQKLHATTPGK